MITKLAVVMKGRKRVLVRQDADQEVLPTVTCSEAIQNFVDRLETLKSDSDGSLILLQIIMLNHLICAICSFTLLQMTHTSILVLWYQDLVIV